ncbi:MAG: ThiF family adenylyltransferase [Spirochaetia bacterium]
MELKITMNTDRERYARQIILPEIGEVGQKRLLETSVAVLGCGALGTNIANLMVRAGVGQLRIVDRDVVEPSNLQRQVLFDENDAANGLPKAIAAVHKLGRINSQVNLDPVVTDIDPYNVETLIRDVDIVLDGTDNFETRFLINDACIKLGLSWIYGAVIGTEGMVMAIVPNQTPCFRCLLAEMPPPGSTPTCDTVGVLGTAAAWVAALEVTEAMKLLLGYEKSSQGRLSIIDIWTGSVEQMQISKPDTPCPACDLREFEFLQARQGSWAVVLCGRNSVQINVKPKKQVSFSQLAERLRVVGSVDYNDNMLRLRLDQYELWVFPDGRTIVKGCGDPAVGRAIYARYIGV